MTQNARMKAPVPMEIEIIGNSDLATDQGKAKRRMDRICASPQEQALYGYNPNAARGNLRPGQPTEYYED